MGAFFTITSPSLEKELFFIWGLLDFLVVWFMHELVPEFALLFDSRYILLHCTSLALHLQTCSCVGRSCRKPSWEARLSIPSTGPASISTPGHPLRAPRSAVGSVLVPLPIPTWERSPQREEIEGRTYRSECKGAGSLGRGCGIQQGPVVSKREAELKDLESVQPDHMEDGRMCPEEEVPVCQARARGMSMAATKRGC